MRVLAKQTKGKMKNIKSFKKPPDLIRLEMLDPLV